MLRNPEVTDRLSTEKKSPHKKNVLLKLYSHVMERYTTQYSFNYTKNVRIQGHLSSENCLLMNPLKWVLSVEQCGLWLNSCQTTLRVHLNRAPFGLDPQLCIFILSRFASKIFLIQFSKAKCLHLFHNIIVHMKFTNIINENEKYPLG